jgi:hypothetical protein
MGIKDDLNLEKDQYQWLGSLFYFGKFDHYISLLQSIPLVFRNHWN